MEDKKYILVCNGEGCSTEESEKICSSFRQQCDAQGIGSDVQVVTTSGFGLVDKGTIVKVLPEGSLYINMDAQKVERIVSEHLVKGKEVREYLYDEETAVPAKELGTDEFYQKQFRIVLRNCGMINPDNIEEYIARGRLCRTGESSV